MLLQLLEAWPHFLIHLILTSGVHFADIVILTKICKKIRQIMMEIPAYRLLCTSYFSSYNINHKCDTCKIGKIHYTYFTNNVEKMLFLKIYDACIIKYNMESASINGHIDFLEYWKIRANYKDYYTTTMDYASKNGYIHILQWWFESGLQLAYSDLAIKFACKFGQLNVLKWWFNSGLKLHYTEEAINVACYYGHIDILNFWLEQHLKTGIPLRYDADSMDFASYTGRIEVLDWWFNVHKLYKLPLYYSGYSFNSACELGNIAVLDWWYKHRKDLELIYCSYIAIELAVFYSQSDVLKWWLTTDLDIQISNCVFVTSYNDEISDLLQKLKARTLT